MGQLIINDAFQSQQMVRRRQHLDKEPLGTQHPVEFSFQSQGEQAGQQPHTAVLYRQMGRRGAEPIGTLVPPRGPAHRFLGNVHSG